MKIPPNRNECLLQTPPYENGGGADGCTSEEDAADGETPELLLKKLMEAAQRLWTHIKLGFAFVMVDLGGYRFLDRLIQWSVRNPYAATCIVAGALIFLLPFLLMLGIGLSTLLMTLTGFIVLEGILLSMVATLLIGCVGCLFLVALFVKQLNRTA